MPSGEKVKGSYSWVAWAILIAVLGLAAADAVLATAPAPRAPDFIATILASRAVVSAIRISIIFAAAFVVLSVIALATRRQWLRRIGPVEVSEAMSRMGSEGRHFEERLDRTTQEVDELEAAVAYAQQLIEKEIYDRDQSV